MRRCLERKKKIVERFSERDARSIIQMSEWVTEIFFMPSRSACERAPASKIRASIDGHSVENGSPQKRFIKKIWNNTFFSFSEAHQTTNEQVV